MFLMSTFRCDFSFNPSSRGISLSYTCLSYWLNFSNNDNNTSNLFSHIYLTSCMGYIKWDCYSIYRVFFMIHLKKSHQKKREKCPYLYLSGILSNSYKEKYMIMNPSFYPNNDSLLPCKSLQRETISCTKQIINHQKIEYLGLKH